MHADPGTNAQLYQWSCSALNTSTNRNTLPDLRYGDDENVASIRGGLLPSDLDIYPVPSTLNCSGTVSAVEYCYAGLRSDVTYGTNHPVFTLLTLEQNGLTFRITGMISVHSTPTDQKCTDISVPIIGTVVTVYH